MSKLKYSKEFLEPLVLESHSVLEILRRLGIKTSGGIHKLISDRITKYNLDTSHFHGRSARKGIPAVSKLTSSDILVLNRIDRREHIEVLRRAFIESGAKIICEQCSLGEIWNNKPLVLQIDHKNGNCLDNRVNNLRFICANCHTQTDTFGVKNVKSKST